MSGDRSNSGRKHDRPRGVPSRGPGVYRHEAKAAGGLVCQECGIVQQAGRWYFGEPPSAQLPSGLCPACRRIRDGYPAGTLRIPARLLARRDELLGLIRNVEAAEKPDHPLERLMGIEESGGDLVVTTTGVHLAREIAHRLAKQFHSKPRIRYADGEDLVHVDWQESVEES
jgi:hypothetical protein